MTDAGSLFADDPAGWTGALWAALVGAWAWIVIVGYMLRLLAREQQDAWARGERL